MDSSTHRRPHRHDLGLRPRLDIHLRSMGAVDGKSQFQRPARRLPERPTKATSRPCKFPKRPPPPSGTAKAVAANTTPLPHPQTIHLRYLDFPGIFTFENWNCLVSKSIYRTDLPYVIRRDDLYRLCKYTRLPRYLILGVLALAFCRLTLSVWAKKRRIVAERRKAIFGAATMRELEERYTSGKGGSVVGKAMELQASSIYELPACQMSHVEADDVGYQEMQGDDGGREMLGNEVAVEAPDHGSRRHSV